MLKEVSRVENQEIIKNSLIRAKMMELLAMETGRDNKRLEYFMTGLFSMIDILLNRDIQTIINEIELTEDVKEALLGKDTKMRDYLQCVIEYEQADWNCFEERKKRLGIDNDHFSSLYLRAIEWEVQLQVFN
jgi:EAL and modified HD-GYP domain-containing signal transduction protein